jgi:hypothetical protein
VHLQLLQSLVRIWGQQSAVLDMLSSSADHHSDGILEPLRLGYLSMMTVLGYAMVAPAAVATITESMIFCASIAAIVVLKRIMNLLLSDRHAQMTMALLMASSGR